MASRFTGNIEKVDIKEQMVLIDGSNSDYITPSGTVYKLYNNGKYYKKLSHINHHNGYVYIGITFHCFGEKPVNKNRRLHVLLAKAFIPRVEGCDIVGHLDNVKHNYTLDNLYWTTTKDNSQKAVDDGLSVNDIGIHDSQSIHVGVYLNTGKLVAVYGSIGEAGRFIEGTDNSSIQKVLDNGATTSIKGYLYRSITKEFYNENSELQFLELTTTKINKVRTNIKVEPLTGGVYIFSSQKAAGLAINLLQANISRALKTGESLHGWVFSRTEQSTTDEKNSRIPKIKILSANDSIQVGCVLESNNYGKFEVIAFESYKKIKIKFLETGYERWTKGQTAKMGKIKDPLAPHCLSKSRRHDHRNQYTISNSISISQN